MAGHSHAKNIMHRKGKSDCDSFQGVFEASARKSRWRPRWACPIPDFNPRLRLAVLNARAQSMPKDNIQRAINKASTEARELRGNPLRGLWSGRRRHHRRDTDRQPQPHRRQCPRRSFPRWAVRSGKSNSVAFMFDRVGEIDYPAKAGSADKVMEAAIEAGADDVETR